MLFYLAGFFGFLVVFLAVIAFTQRVARKSDSGWRAAAFAPIVLSIAVAYEIAHNYGLLSETWDCSQQRSGRSSDWDTVRPSTYSRG